jgi:hypothetical protein
MKKVPYSDDELKVIGEHITTTSSTLFNAKSPMYNTPITPKENVWACVRREGAMWIPSSSDFITVESRTNLDHVARAEVMDMGPPQPLEEKGGKDLFGVEWVYVEKVGGSMVKPGNPMLEDANDWPKVIKFPDVDKLDWDECRRLNTPLNETKRAMSVTFQNGLFERLISFMDFENAALAIIDDEQKDAVHALFAKLCDMYEAMITKYLEILKLDGVIFHDDWGSQRAPFFSLDVCMEMIVPYLKRIADFCHSKGLWFQQHCCGKNELLVPAMIAAGVDMWYPQAMNDVDMLREKYGDKIMFSITPPPIPKDATEEEIDALAKALVDKYADGFEERPFVVHSFMSPPEFAKAVYKYSRMALSK